MRIWRGESVGAEGGVRLGAYRGAAVGALGVWLGVYLGSAWGVSRVDWGGWDRSPVYSQVGRSLGGSG